MANESPSPTPAPELNTQGAPPEQAAPNPVLEAAPKPQPAPKSPPPEPAPTGAQGDADDADTTLPASLLADDEPKNPKQADAPGDDAGGDAVSEYQPFTLPEGMELDQQALSHAAPVFKKLGLDQAGAQELVSLFAEIDAQRTAAAAQGLQRQHVDLVRSWQDEVKADPNIGGKHLPATLSAAKKALNAFGSPELIALLDGYGFTSNPAVLRFLKGIGEAFSEDLAPIPGGGSPPHGKGRLADDIYGS